MKHKIRCLSCGKEKETYRSDTKFCSKKCRDSFSYIPRDKKGKYIKCSFCGKEVWTQPWRFKFKTRFCSLEHYVKYIKEKSFHRECIVCKKIFYCQPSQIKYRNRKTCSVTCMGKLHTQNAVNNRIKNGFTKHQIDRSIRYSKEADTWRRAVFERDNYTCQMCGVKGGYLEAHHIKPFAYFSEVRFDISNGQTLCKKCHSKTKISCKALRKKYDTKRQKKTH